MSLRLIKTVFTTNLEANNSSVKVYRDADWQEFVVVGRLHGEQVSTYQTDSKEDAMGTANHIVKEIQAKLG